MKATELGKLIEDDLVTIGAHTMTHPHLSSLSPSAQSTEIVSSKEQLERITGKPVLTFAYPYGQANDFADDTVRAVAQAGFVAACSTIPGVVQAGDNPLRLGRCEIGNWDRDRFEKHIEWWFTR
jgi:peptidoglycan/xylan/chitin deacetylase (PgdA/CDA1 family)